MKLSKTTKEILKNFSIINSGIELKQGNILRTIDSNKTLLAEAELDESLPRDFAIYNLQKFLSIENILSNPDFVFEESSVTITDGVKKVCYRAADPNMITTPPSKNFTLPDAEVSFELSEESFESVRKAATLLELDDLVFATVDGKVMLQARDLSSPTSDSFEVDTGVETDREFRAVFKRDSVVILPGRYKIDITNKAGLFQNQDINVKYWVAIDPSSTFGTK